MGVWIDCVVGNASGACSVVIFFAASELHDFVRSSEGFRPPRDDMDFGGFLLVRTTVGSPTKCHPERRRSQREGSYVSE